MAILTITLPRLHKWQQEIAQSPARFKIIAAGRRFGKTRLATVLAVSEALREGRVWWVAPTYPMATIGWRLIKSLCQQIPGVNIRESERRAEMPGLGFIETKSADRPDALRGEGLDFVVLDECAFLKEDAWSQSLRPALADRQGRAVFISTPKGRNWFWKLYQRAQDLPDWETWQLPTSENPYISAEEIEEMRRLLPERVYLQEVEAQFVEDAGTVFRHVAEMSTATPQKERIPDHEYVIGVDLAKHQDWSVLAVVDLTTHELVYLDRFNQVDYMVQARRLEALAERFQPSVIIIERNSAGEPFIEMLQREKDLPIQPFTTTNATKAQAVEALSLAFERGDIRIIPDPILIGELQAFEAERLPSGMLRYGAPAGMHDDCVMALALAWQGTGTNESLFLW
ncbi:MAG: hypothetical protein D6706_15890 [Chloroflexi bacterium]|nr:MAG: hypothetical protein D6706_15890 [Chloroflexota bacterium]